MKCNSKTASDAGGNVNEDGVTTTMPSNAESTGAGRVCRCECLDASDTETTADCT